MGVLNVIDARVSRLRKLGQVQVGPFAPGYGKPAASEEAGRRELVAAFDRRSSQSLDAFAAARVAMTLGCRLSPDRMAPNREARGGLAGHSGQISRRELSWCRRNGSRAREERVGTSSSCCRLREMEAPHQPEDDTHERTENADAGMNTTNNYEGASIRCSVAHLFHHQRAAACADLLHNPIRLEDTTTTATATTNR